DPSCQKNSTNNTEQNSDTHSGINDIPAFIYSFLYVFKGNPHRNSSDLLPFIIINRVESTEGWTECPFSNGCIPLSFQGMNFITTNERLADQFGIRMGLPLSFHIHDHDKK